MWVVMMSKGNIVFDSISKAIKPDPRHTVTEWADKFRVLTTEASAEAGKFRTSRTPYVKEIADSCSPSVDCAEVKVMKGTQIGLSTTADNVAMCYLDLYPCPILYIVPTETLAKGTSKRRFTPAIKAIPHLRDKILGGKTKDDVGGMYTKEVAGGGITLGWSNSTSSFRSFSARLVILDDVDGFGEFGEGNVMTLAKARADAFSNKRIFINSTPTTEGNSNIATEFEDSDQREYFMPCPHCHTLITFEWHNFIFDHKDYTLKGHVKYKCPECGTLIEERYKTQMMSEEGGAKWIPQQEHIHRGYLVPSFLSPIGWLSWDTIAREFLKAKKLLNTGDARLMQTWVNTRQARPYRPVLDGVDITDPNSRTETYDHQVPDGVLMITAGVDTQDDRVEVCVLGHGRFGELFFIDYKVIAGDIQYDATKQELDVYLNTEWVCKNDYVMKIHATAIDTGGHRTKSVYDYVKSRLPNRVFGVKGSSTVNAPLVNKTISKLNLGDLNLFSVGTVVIKDDFYARLAITEVGVNYVHFPNTDIFDKRFFNMLTAEKRDNKGKYIKIRTRNEAIDCTVYALVALYISEVSVDLLPSPMYHVGVQPVAKEAGAGRRKPIDPTDEY